MELSKLTDDALIDLAVKTFEQCENMMVENCEGGLQYGWDWPTFRALFPDKWGEFNAIRGEGVKRGLAS